MERDSHELVSAGMGDGNTTTGVQVTQVFLSQERQVSPLDKASPPHTPAEAEDGVNTTVTNVWLSFMTDK